MTIQINLDNSKTPGIHTGAIWEPQKEMVLELIDFRFVKNDSDEYFLFGKLGELKGGLCKKDDKWSVPSSEDIGKINIFSVSVSKTSKDKEGNQRKGFSSLIWEYLENIVTPVLDGESMFNLRVKFDPAHIATVDILNNKMTANPDGTWSYESLPGMVQVVQDDLRRQMLNSFFELTPYEGDRLTPDDVVKVRRGTGNFKQTKALKDCISDNTSLVLEIAKESGLDAATLKDLIASKQAVTILALCDVLMRR